MKKILLSAAVVAICAGSSFAQEKTVTENPKQETSSSRSRTDIQKARVHKYNPEKMAAIKTARLDKAVKLTESQKKQVNDIYLEEAKQHQERMTHRQEVDKKIQSVLTKDQVQKYDAAKKVRMEKMRKVRSERMSATKQ